MPDLATTSVPGISHGSGATFMKSRIVVPPFLYTESRVRMMLLAHAILNEPEQILCHYVEMRAALIIHVGGKADAV